MKCSVARCLGHAPQKTVEVRCTRCQSTKYVPDPIIPLDRKGYVTGPPIPLVLPYTCVRCRAVLAGRKATDPFQVATPAQLAARTTLQAARNRPVQPIQTGKQPRGRAGQGETPLPCSEPLKPGRKSPD
jgi:hypothetical protein